MNNYIEQLKANALIEYFDLLPGSESTSHGVEILKLQFPFIELEPYFSFLSVCDGQGNNSVVDIYFGFFAMPAHDIVLAVESLNEVRVTCEDDYDENHWTSYPQDTICRTVYSERWFPFGSDFCGNYLGVDFAPGPNGKLGQVIIFGRDIDERVVIADSLLKFERWLIEIIDSRQYSIEKQVGFLLRLLANNKERSGTIQELSKHISSYRNSSTP